MRVSEIRVKQIRVNQGLGVHTFHKRKGKLAQTLSFPTDLNQFSFSIMWQCAQSYTTIAHSRILVKLC